MSGTMGSTHKPVTCITPIFPFAPGAVLKATANNAGFEALSDSVGKPAGEYTAAGTYDFDNPLGGLQLIVAMTGADNCTCLGRIVAVDQLTSFDAPGTPVAAYGSVTNPKVTQFTPFVICEFRATASAATGVSGGNLGLTWRYADTFAFTLPSRIGTSRCKFLQDDPSGGGDRAARVEFDGIGAPRIYVQLSLETATAAIPLCKPISLV